MEKPKFSEEQLMPVSTAAKNFGTIRKRATEENQILLKRIECIEKDPSSSVSWKDLRRN